MTRFLADENVPRASILLLRQYGLDIRSIGEDAPGTPDARVLEEARKEGRVLLTFDRDFGELIYRRGLEAPPAVVYLRLVPATPDEPATIVRNLLDHAEIRIQGRLTVVTREGVRQRPLP